MRIYDPRLGKFLSVDPIAYGFAELTPYQFASDNPILNIDLDGLEGMQFAAPGSKYHIPGDVDEDGKLSKKEATASAYLWFKTIKVTAIIATTIFQPEIGIPWAVADISGVPVNPSPQAWSAVGGTVIESTTSAAIEEAASAPKATPLLVAEENGYAIVKDANGEVAGSGFLAQGELNLTIKTKGTSLSGRGSDVANSIYGYISENFGEINSINGTWRAGEMGANLTQFNEFVKQGSTLEEAALKTFTGKIADKLEFNNVKINQQTLKQNANGDYISVDVQFTKSN
jgi:hypothetical protein